VAWTGGIQVSLYRLMARTSLRELGQQTLIQARVPFQMRSAMMMCCDSRSKCSTVYYSSSLDYNSTIMASGSGLGSPSQAATGNTACQCEL